MSLGSSMAFPRLDDQFPDLPLGVSPPVTTAPKFTFPSPDAVEPFLFRTPAQSRVPPRPQKEIRRNSLTRSRELRVSSTLGVASAPASPKDEDGEDKDHIADREAKNLNDEKIEEKVEGTRTTEQPASDGLRHSSRVRETSFHQVLLEELSYEEKKRLASAVVALDPDGLSTIMDIIRTHEAELLERGDEGFQFDLMDLKSDTVAAIREFVDARAQTATLVSHELHDHEHEELESDDPEYQEPRRKADLKISGSRRNPQLLMSMPPSINRKISPNLEDVSCELCGKKYPSSQRPFRVSCFSRFSDRSNLSKHQRTHSGDKPFQCPHCDKAFRHSSTLKDHENIHKDTKPYLCGFPGCGKTFANQANVKRHERTHTDVKPFTCMHCGRAFNQSSNCKQHEKKCGGSTSAIKRRSFPVPDSPSKRPRLE